MTYESLLTILHDKHFYPSQQTLAGKITGLQVYCSPILRDSRKKVLQSALVGTGARVDWMGNDHDYLLITLPDAKTIQQKPVRKNAAKT